MVSTTSTLAGSPSPPVRMITSRTSSLASAVAVALDDLQWARAPELLLLKHIVRSTMPLHLLIIGTYRDTDLSRTHPLTAVLADLHRESGIEPIRNQHQHRFRKGVADQ